MIIAIDGPAGSGKSSVAKEIAKKLNFTYIDTGAMYRALTLKALKNNIDLNDSTSLNTLLQHIEIKLIPNIEKDILQIFVNDEEVTEAIRRPDVSNSVSIVAKHSNIRKLMVEKQRDFSKTQKNIVMDGRDIATVVFPNAELKIFLTASVEERAKRRLKELLEKKINTKLEDLIIDIQQRDELDIKRENSPLKEANGSVVLDTTILSFEEVVNKIIGLT